MAVWAQALATVVAVVVGGLVAYFLRDQQRAKIHEKRLDAYAQLWEVTKEFRINGPPMDSKCRQDLADKLTNWYYQPGGGMLLMDRTLEAQLWDLPDGVPLVFCRRISIDADGRTIEISDADYPADRTELQFVTPLKP
jgi:hypothetical protein